MNTFARAARRPSRLAPALAGKIMTPEHGRFDAARRAWNLAIDQDPAAVVFPESAQDVAAAVLFAAEWGQRIAPQATGHGAAALGPVGDAILLKTERMRGLAIDSVGRVARVEAGVLASEVVRAAARHGLTPLTGSSPDVGVVGYTLGGGLSFLGRKHGLAANNVRAIGLVTADGSLVRADRDHEPDLFWAVRGGGGSFGIVTAIELELVPITHTLAGILWYPIERAGEVLHAWADLTRAEPPDDLTTAGRLLNLPPLREIPEPVRGKSFVVVEAIHLGDPATADELLASLRALGPVNDTIQMVPAAALLDLFLEPEHPVPVVGDGLTLAELPPRRDRCARQRRRRRGRVPPRVRRGPPPRRRARSRPAGERRALLDRGELRHVRSRRDPHPDIQGVVRTQITTVKQAMGPWTARHMSQLRRHPQVHGHLLDRAGIRRLPRHQGDGRSRATDPQRTMPASDSING